MRYVVRHNETKETLLSGTREEGKVVYTGDDADQAKRMRDAFYLPEDDPHGKREVIIHVFDGDKWMYATRRHPDEVTLG